jgi:hypothetical protein
MIMDGTMDHESLWNAMYALRVDKPTLDQIQRHSTQLIGLSESLQKWQAGKYSKTLRFYNSESLELVRDFWRRYASADNLTPSFLQNYNNAIKNIYETRHKNVKPIDTIAASTNSGILTPRNPPVYQIHCLPIQIVRAVVSQSTPIQILSRVSI